jgi:hypothetical protein
MSSNSSIPSLVLTVIGKGQCYKPLMIVKKCKNYRGMQYYIHMDVGGEDLMKRRICYTSMCVGKLTCLYEL